MRLLSFPCKKKRVTFLLQPFERLGQVEPHQIQHGAVVPRDLPPQDLEPAVLAPSDRSERGGSAGCGRRWGEARVSAFGFFGPWAAVCNTVLLRSAPRKGSMQ